MGIRSFRLLFGYEGREDFRPPRGDQINECYHTSISDSQGSNRPKPATRATSGCLVTQQYSGLFNPAPSNQNSNCELIQIG